MEDKNARSLSRLAERIFILALLAVLEGGTALPVYAEGSSVPSATEDLLRERQQLLKQYQKRGLELKDLVQIEETKDQVTIDLYVNKFFLPNSLTLQNDGLVALNQLVDQLKKRQGKRVILRTIFSATSSSTDFKNSRLGFFKSRRLPGAKYVQMEDSVSDALITERSMIVFSYLISASFEKSTPVAPEPS